MKTLKILVPLDGSSNSLRGLEFASKLASLHNVDVVGYHIIPKSLKYGIPVTEEIRKKSIKIAENILKDANKRAKKRGMLIKTKFQVGGNIGQSIVDFAHKNKFDLIVIGSRGPNPSVDMFLGSVANYVIHRAKMPVAIVK